MLSLIGRSPTNYGEYISHLSYSPFSFTSILSVLGPCSRVFVISLRRKFNYNWAKKGIIINELTWFSLQWIDCWPLREFLIIFFISLIYININYFYFFFTNSFSRIYYVDNSTFVDSFIFSASIHFVVNCRAVSL